MRRSNAMYITDGLIGIRAIMCGRYHDCTPGFVVNIKVWAPILGVQNSSRATACAGQPWVGGSQCGSLRAVGCGRAVGGRRIRDLAPSPPVPCSFSSAFPFQIPSTTPRSAVHHSSPVSPLARTSSSVSSLVVPRKGVGRKGSASMGHPPRFLVSQQAPSEATWPRKALD